MHDFGGRIGGSGGERTIIFHFYIRFYLNLDFLEIPMIIRRKERSDLTGLPPSTRFSYKISC